MDFMMSFLETLGTIAFAVSGAIEAMKKQMDLLGVIVPVSYTHLRAHETAANIV